MPVASEVDKLVFEYEGSLGFTILQNIFIELFMPSANGSHVKVYLAGLKRCFGHKDSQWATHRTIADEAGKGVSISTVKRAWKYWESVGLVRIFPRFLRDINNPNDYSTQRTKVYRIPTSSIIRFTNLQELAQQMTVRQALAQAQAEIAVAVDSAGGVSSPVNRGSGHEWTEGRVMGEPLINTTKKVQGEKVQDKTTAHQENHSEVVSGLLNTHFQEEVSEDDIQAVSTLYADLTKKSKVGKADMSHLARLLSQYGPEDVTDALQETSRSERTKGSFLRYTEGILTNWSKEGKRVTITDDKGSAPKSTANHFRPKGSTAQRDPEEAKYYGEYLKLEQALFDSQPIEEPQEITMDISPSNVSSKDIFKTVMAEMRRGLA